MTSSREKSKKMISIEIKVQEYWKQYWHISQT
jgi:hypothetical protein